MAALDMQIKKARQKKVNIESVDIIEAKPVMAYRLKSRTIERLTCDISENRDRVEAI